MRVAVLGCGRWGSFLAWYAESLGHRVTLWGRPESCTLRHLRETRENDYLRLPEGVCLSDDIAGAVDGADYALIAIRAQELRALCRGLAACLPRRAVLCMKGIEETSGTRLSEIYREEVGGQYAPAIWVGPGHVQEFLRGVPNCMVIDSEDPACIRQVVETFTSPLIRFYYGTDLLGNEIGAAAKNVIGLAAGMLDGLKLASMKGALMARGAHEVSCLIAAMGGNALTAYGLAHLGDYEATLFSPHSQNHCFGEAFVRGEPFARLAEGVPTAAALLRLSQAYGVDLPVCRAVHTVIAEDGCPHDMLNCLFARPLKSEFIR